MPAPARMFIYLLQDAFLATKVLKLFLRSYHIGDAMKIEEYVPQITPTIRGSANALISATPKIYSERTVKNVVADVKRLRVSV